MSDIFGEPGERALRIANRIRFTLAALTAVGLLVGGVVLVDNLNTPD